jgi:hypothetical protein
MPIPLSSPVEQAPATAAPANTPFLGCDSEQTVCAIPHMAAAAGQPAAGTAQPAEPAAACTDDGTQVAVRREPSVSQAPPSAEPAGRPGQAVQAPAWSPERPVMEILFRCIEAGRRYFGVRLNGQEIFVGTRSECDRFLKIHDRKVAEEQAEARRVPRGRPAQLRVYRTLRA